MAFFDDKNNGFQTDSEVDPVDEILKHINERKIEMQAAEQNNDNSEQAIQPSEEPVTETIAEPVEEPLSEDEACICCGQKRKDTSVSEDYEFCADCRKEMLKAPLKWKGFVAAISMIIIAGVAVVVAAFTAAVAMPVTEAEGYVAENRLNQALSSYAAADTAATDLNTQLKVTNFFTAGTKTFVKNMLVTAKASSPLAVGETLSTVVKDVASYKNPWLSELKQYSDTYTLFKNTQAAVEPIVSKYQSAKPATVPYDDLIAKLEALKTGKDAKKYAAYFIEYYKTYVAVLANKGPAAELEHMLEVKRLAPEAAWLYSYYLADCYKRLGKYDDMIKVCNEIIATNVNSVEVYSLKARAYCAQKQFTKALAVCDEMDLNNAKTAASYALRAEIYRRMDDIKKAESICADGIKNSEGSTELYRQQAIVFLLKGAKYKKAAYDAVYNAYNSASANQDTTLELMDTIALCASIAGEKEMFTQTVSSLQQNGYSLADSVAKYIKGTMTLKEIFVTGIGDVL
ncbi:MAG: hypothetical protein WCN92_00060 [Eubacteriales bacterium]